MPPSNLASYRPDIDGLRAFAVISILLFHLGIPYFPGGFVGVDIFFVISGFLITGIIKKEVESTGQLRFGPFYMRRVRRLFPALFVVLSLTAVAAFLLLSPAYLSRFGGGLSSSLAGVSNIYFWTEADYFDVSSKVKPLLHTWSLSVEGQFYLLWPLLLLLLPKTRRAWVAPALLLFIGLASLAANIPYGHSTGGAWNQDGRATIFFLFPFRVFEFVSGALLAWTAPRSLKARWPNEALFWLGMALMTYAVLAFSSKMLFPSYHGLVPCIGAALAIYAGNRAASAKVLTNPIAVGIGLISYSLYLVHWPLIVFWQYLGGNLGWTDRVMITALSLGLAYASYRLVEQPFRAKRFDMTAPAWRYPIIFASVVVLAVGVHMKQSHGWPWRVPAPAVFQNVGDAAKFHTEFYGGAGYPYYGPVETSKPADIVLMGDSHGRHYAEGVFKILAQPNNLAFYNASGASFFHLPNLIRTTEGCDWGALAEDRLNKALNYIQHGNTPLVIISHGWVFQTSLAARLDAQGKRLGQKVTTDDVIAGILALKDRIGNSPLVVIGEVPTPGGRNLYDIFTSPRLLFFSGFEPEQYLTIRAKPNLAAYNAALAKAAEETGKYIFLDPHDVLCTAGICRNLDSQNRLIYSDDAHLSKYGSVEVIKSFLPQIKKALEYRNVAERKKEAGRQACRPTLKALYK